jgi:SAM-dependent methyltransferase
MAIDYGTTFDTYWNAARQTAAPGFIDADTLAHDILLACGGVRMLDVGAGMGQLVHALLRLGVNAEGIDVSAVAVAQAALTAPRRFRQASLLALPYEAAAFDTLIATNVLECLAPDDLATALAELRRVTARTLFLRISTVAAADGPWHHTVQPRRWWEERLFAAGFRKHPAYYQLNDYEALEHDGESITIVLERLPEAAAKAYPLSALAEERDLHMDMLRESGSRSDAHVARYQWAARYIRPGDAVLDAACGLGYGSYLLQAASTARSTLGIDGSDYAYDYAQANFASALPGLAFRCGMLPEALADIADHSIDVVVSFETLEHIDQNVATLAEFHRILTPGGRIITSVPNDWSDDSGEDPNPFHLHVYTLQRLARELGAHFILEQLVAQTANQYKMGSDRVTWHAAGRSLRPVPLAVLSEGAAPPAEWWLAVAMRSPLEGATVPYRETQYPTFEATAWHVTSYGRDYVNPWLPRALVDSGHRLRDGAALAALCEQVLLTAAPDSPDRGAALCVLAYQLLATGQARTAQIEALAQRVAAYLAAGPKTPHGVRWQVALHFVLGKLWLGHGDFIMARAALVACTALDPLVFSPLLCNRVIEARLILGSLDLAAGQRDGAVAHWRAGIALAARAVSGDWAAALGDLAAPAEFALPELASVFEYASACGYALAHVDEVHSKPWWWLHPRRDRLSQAAAGAKQLRHTKEALEHQQAELGRYARQADDLVRLAQAGRDREAQLQTELQQNGAMLASYRRQADEFAHQVAALQAIAQAAGAQRDELAAYRAQADEYARQVAALQAIAQAAGAQRDELAAYRAQADEYARQVTALQAASEAHHGQLLAALAHNAALAEQLAAEQAGAQAQRADFMQQQAMLQEALDERDQQLRAMRSAMERFKKGQS